MDGPLDAARASSSGGAGVGIGYGLGAAAARAGARCVYSGIMRSGSRSASYAAEARELVFLQRSFATSCLIDATMSKKVSASAAGSVRIGDLYVHRIGFGTMELTGQGAWGPPADVDAMIDLLRTAVAHDVSFIDTADAYGPAVAERLIAQALHPYDGVLVATKGGLTRPGSHDWHPNGDPDYVYNACLASMERLRIDKIDLYQLHASDPSRSFAGSMQALRRLQREGKVRSIGVSNVSEEQLKEALASGPVASVQNRYNIADRQHEAVLRLCEQQEIAFIPYTPLAGAELPAVQEMAAKYNVFPHQLVLAWLLQHSPVMLPIPGTTSVIHLLQNIAAANINIDRGDVEYLNNVIQ